VKVTERYAHLRPGLFSEEDFEAVSVDLREPKVIPFEPKQQSA
jgi:hypothetical protein